MADERALPALLTAPPALVRSGAGLALGVPKRLLGIVRRRESPLDLLADARDELIAALRTALGVDELSARLDRMDAAMVVLPPVETPEPPAPAPQAPPLPAPADLRTLRRRAAALLEDHGDDGGHPAFAAILDQLAPGDARLLVRLARRGAEPVADVQAVTALGRPLRTLATLVSPAGSPAALENLLRLGLIRVADEATGDESAYRQIEADHAGRAPRVRALRRSLVLSELGAAFAADVLDFAPR